MTADGHWGLYFINETLDGLRSYVLLSESLPDIENAKWRSVSDKNRSSVFKCSALFGKVTVDLILGVYDVPGP
jgi:hypothetical protein